MREWIDIIQRTGRSNRQMILSSILKEAQKWKPGGYDAAVSKRRDYFTGNQTSHLRNHLAMRFPNTHARMQPFTVPLYKHLAEQRATIYKSPPQRTIVDDEWQTGLLNEVYDAAQINNRFQKLEQIAAACGLAFARIGWDEYDQRIVVNPYWPDGVAAVLHPDWPTHLERALIIVAEITSAAGVAPDSKNRRYEIWQRQDNGWSYTIATADGSTYSPIELGPQVIYPVLPWVAVPFDASTNVLFTKPSDDDITAQDAVNAIYTDLLYTIENQAFTQIYYSGPEQSDLVGGPGSVWMAGEGGSFGTLNYTPQIAAVKDAVSDIIGRLLVLNAVSPSSASADPRYESGVALKVQNAPMYEARAARVPTYREIEELRLWPVLRDIYNYHVQGSRFAPAARMKWQPGDLAVALDDEAEFRIAQGRVATNVSTWPREMVRLKLASTLADAESVYTASEDYNKEHKLPDSYVIPFVRSETASEPSSNDDSKG